MNFQNSAHDHAEHSQTPDSRLKPAATSVRGAQEQTRSSQHFPRPSSERRSTSAAHEQQRERRRSRRNRSSSTTAQGSLGSQPVLVPREPSPPSQSGSPFEIDDSHRHLPESSARVMEYHDAGRREATSDGAFDQSQLAMFAANNAAHAASMSLKDELTIAAGKVTPGVDDTPYIQYALRALVGEQGQSSRYHLSSGSSDVVDRWSPPPGQSYQAPEYSPHLSRDYEPYGNPSITTVAAELPGSPCPDPLPSNLSQPFPPSSAMLDPEIIPSKRWVGVTKEMRRRTDPQNRTYQPLTFKPRIIRLLSMSVFILLCLMMMAALIFTVEYSQRHQGLTPYPGSIYSGQYFLFRILPQLLGGFIVLYSQCIAVTSFRIIPFAAMASEEPEDRYMAIFRDLFHGTFLLPKWTGPWQFRMFSVAAWLAIFTVPLQSSAFTCIWDGTKWMWAPVKDVVWGLIGLYIILVLASISLTTYWFGCWTGLLWDVRSIGDLMPLLNRSNGMASYKEGELAETRDDLKVHLRERRNDRLGYWRTEDMVTGGVWYTIGVSSDDNDALTQSSLIQQKNSNGAKADGENVTPLGSIDGVHGTHLPWCLRDGPILLVWSATTLLFVALLVVSFLPQTRLEQGFRGGVTARPDKSDFSAANFIYTFVPSLVGMVFYLLLQGIDEALRIQQPWAGFFKAEGSPARESLMADYAACLPLQSFLRAAMNGHWRVALVSLVSALSIFIPILGGGLLMALTGSDGTVRMYPNKVVFGTLLALLAFYVIGLGLAVPFRRQLALPRPVTRIADIISLCSAGELVSDAAFRSVRSREDLKTRLGIGRDDAREESRWYFGLVVGRDEHRLSVRRMKKVSEKSARLVEMMV